MRPKREKNFIDKMKPWEQFLYLVGEFFLASSCIVGLHGVSSGFEALLINTYLSVYVSERHLKTSA